MIVRQPVSFGRHSGESRKRATLMAQSQWGESPRRADAFLPETERNCVAERRGGEQREVNHRSAG